MKFALTSSRLAHSHFPLSSSYGRQLARQAYEPITGNLEGLRNSIDEDMVGMRT